MHRYNHPQQYYRKYFDEDFALGSVSIYYYPYRQDPPWIGFQFFHCIDISFKDHKNNWNLVPLPLNVCALDLI